MGCWYPGSRGLRELWENILSRRVQFRRMLDQRLPLGKYFNEDKEAPDKTYGQKASYIDGFEFDWAGRHIPKSTVDSTDLVHWLTLEVTLRALRDAELSEEQLPKEKTSVIIGNTLTGEISRSVNMRLRWPFVETALRKSATELGLDQNKTNELAQYMESVYKSAFHRIDEDTLAGSLANTIAGRVANYLDLKGGGYTVDGACASSLLAIATACTQLSTQQSNLVIAGGVDISLDTFELIGFAKTGALTADKMRVYDRRASGFTPGEGCGIVILKRLEDALRDQNQIYSVIKGWGVSSDGRGGITMPSDYGQSLALTRAYEMAGYPITDCRFIEGHGTGTAVGDRKEILGISLATLNAKQSAKQNLKKKIGMTSLKSILGHTKAGAGVGAFIKASMAVNQRVIPPTANCEEPNELFQSKASHLYPVINGEILNPNETVRAGISAMGFGGINSHITLESGPKPLPHLVPNLPEKFMLVTNQASEVFFFSANTTSQLLHELKKTLTQIANMAEGELADVSYQLAKAVDFGAGYRVSIVANSPEKLSESIEQVINHVDQEPENTPYYNKDHYFFYSRYQQSARIGFLFPGQGSAFVNMGKNLIKRFPHAKARLKNWDQRFEGNSLSSMMLLDDESSLSSRNRESLVEQLSQTSNTQPAIVFHSLIWADRLKKLGIKPTSVAGHSLGEVTSFAILNQFSEEDIIDLSILRGRLCSESTSESTGMTSVACSIEVIGELLKNFSQISLANHNSPTQMVVSGKTIQLDRLEAQLNDKRIPFRRLKVSCGFHSPYMHDAAEKFKADPRLQKQFLPGQIKFFSTMNGNEVKEEISLADYLSQQLESPVRFTETLQEFAKSCDMIIECGPGRILTNLANDILPKTPAPLVFPVETKENDTHSFNLAVAASFCYGANLNVHLLFQNRFIKEFKVASEKMFITNPCENPLSSPEGWIVNVKTPVVEVAPHAANSTAQVLSLQRKPADNEPTPAVTAPPQKASEASPTKPESDVKTKILQTISQKTGFATSAIKPQMKLLDNMNLDSIKAADLIQMISQNLGIDSAGETNHLSNASVAELITYFEKVATTKTSSVTNVSSTPITTPALGASANTDVGSALKEIFQVEFGFDPQQAGFNNKTLDELGITENKLRKALLAIFEKLSLSENLDVSNLTEKTPDQLIKILINHALLSSQSPQSEKPLHTTSATDTWVEPFVARWMPIEGMPQIRSLRSADQIDGSSVFVINDLTSQVNIDLITQSIFKQGGRATVGNFDELLASTHDCRFIILALDSPEKAWNLSMISEGLNLLYKVSQIPKRFSSGFRYLNLIVLSMGCRSLDHEGFVKSADNLGLMSFLNTLHLERSDLRTALFDIEAKVLSSNLLNAVFDQIPKLTKNSTLHISADDEIFAMVPQHLVMDQQQKLNLKWDSSEVVVVTGGGKGITAICAEEFALHSKVKLALLGRQSVKESTEIQDNLSRMQKKGIQVQYYSCDIMEQQSLQSTLAQIQKQMGPIRGLIHGAGSMHSKVALSTSFDQANLEVSTKLYGLMNVLGHVDQLQMKLIVALSSIIGVTGMPGNIWYGFANENLDLYLRSIRQQHPHLVTRSLAYSVWSEVGMGAKSGAVEQLRRMNIGSISPKLGTDLFVKSLLKETKDTQVIITGRLGGLDTWKMPINPFQGELRYLDRMISFQPGIEMITRTHLSTRRDPYFLEHNYEGSLLFPTVFGLEAFLQSLYAIAPQAQHQAVQFSNLQLMRPIMASSSGLGTDVEIRVCKAQNSNKNFEASIRTSQSDFSTPSFMCEMSLQTVSIAKVDTNFEEFKKLSSLVPNFNQRLYKELLFQGKEFQRIQDLIYFDGERPDDKGTIWITSQTRSKNHNVKASFGEHSDKNLVSHDPFFMDTLLQSAQILIPQVSALPLRINSLRINKQLEENATYWICAELIKNTGSTYITNVTAFNTEGEAVVELTGYELKILKRDRPHSIKPWLSDRSNIQKSPPKTEISTAVAEAASINGSFDFESFYKTKLPSAFMNELNGRPVLNWKMSPTFKQLSNLSRSVYFTHYVQWLGEAREYTLSPVMGQLRKMFESNEWGLVTNDCRVHIAEPVFPDDEILCSFWCNEYDANKGYLKLQATWSKMKDSNWQPVAFFEMGATWVKIVGHGVVQKDKFPSFLDEFALQMVHPNGQSSFALLKTKQQEPQIKFESPAPVFFKDFETTLVDSNFVGNVYFGNYSVWMSRTLENWLFSVTPDLLSFGKTDNSFNYSDCEIQHLRECMPFQKVRASISVASYSSTQANFICDFYLVMNDSPSLKLAVGKISMNYESFKNGQVSPTNLPEDLLNVFRKANKPEQSGKKSA